MAKKAKRLTKRGQPKTGATPGSGKQRSQRERARAATRKHGGRVEGRSDAGRSGRTTAASRAQSQTGPALALANRPRRRRRGTSANVRNRATSAIAAGRAPARSPAPRERGAAPGFDRGGTGRDGRRETGGRRAATRARQAAPDTGRGPSIPLRKLLRTGLPRSAKAPRQADPGGPTGRVKRRARAGYGLKKGATLMQRPPRHREFVGVLKGNIPKR